MAAGAVLMAFDVVGFGALNLDKLFKVNMIAKREEEGFVTDYKESAGGSAAIFCVYQVSRHNFQQKS